MPNYRYFAANLLTDEVYAELPLYGVNCNRQLNQAGEFTGTFRLGTGIDPDDILLSSTVPRKTAIYMERGGVIVWGGIIWSRTYGSEAHTIQLTAQSFESYLAVFKIIEDFIRTNQNQLEIVQDLVDWMQAYSSRSNIGIDTSQIITSGGTLATVNVKSYDDKYIYEVLDELASSETGFDWTIDVVNSATPDVPNKILKLGQPILTTQGSTAPVFEYPGSIDNFYWPESGSNSGTDFTVLGAGTGSKALRATATWPNAVSGGYPIVHKVVPWKGVKDQAQLNKIAQTVADLHGQDEVNPTVTLVGGDDTEFSLWSNLGANVQLELEGPRFPDRKVALRRMIGWELTPASSESNEIIKLRLHGEE